MDELKVRLGSFGSAPFLFVGAGMSKRYVQTDGWVDLLSRMAAYTGKPYAYYSSKANGDLPHVATEIAAVFHELWWSRDEFAASRERWASTVTTAEGPLKVEVAKHTAEALTRIPTEGPRADELEMLSKAVVDGAVTTNYDGLMEHLFADFKVFVGQDELLFSDAQGVGEIYKIHGSADDPESLVLTAADFSRFGERNPYLAAKLLTIFVEHPVVFLGYSLQDEDVNTILVSIARVLTTENLARLQDRLIFVQWSPTTPEPTLAATQIAVEGFAIPIVLVEVSDFLGVFEVLASLTRNFPARLLRQLKERVYELVLSSEPDNSLAVVDIDDATHASEIDVVFGVGVYARLGIRGYVGLSRRDLLDDVLSESMSLDPMRVVNEALPQVLRGAGNTPIYRYLRAANLLTAEGTLLSNAAVDPRIATRVGKGVDPFGVGTGTVRRAIRVVDESGSQFAAIAEDNEPQDVLLALLALPVEMWPFDEIRQWLWEQRDLFVGRLSTAWAKAVCLYDYYRFGLRKGEAA